MNIIDKDIRVQNNCFQSTIPSDSLLKYPLSFLFQAGVSITDQYFLFLDLAKTFLTSFITLSISSEERLGLFGTILTVPTSFFSTTYSSPLSITEFKISKNLFLASVAD